MPMSHGRRERWIAIVVFARGLSLDQIVGQQLASISLVPSDAPSGSEPFYRRVPGRLRLAGQLVRRQNRSLYFGDEITEKVSGLAPPVQSEPSSFHTPRSSLPTLFFSSHCYEMEIG